MNLETASRIVDQCDAHNEKCEQAGEPRMEDSMMILQHGDKVFTLGDCRALVDAANPGFLQKIAATFSPAPAVVLPMQSAGEKIVNYLVARVTEASTHGGFAGVFLAVQQIMEKNYALGVPALLTAICAIFLPEKKAAA